MRASILVTTYGRPDHLHWCLESLCRQNLTGLDCEVLVLNDGLDDDGSREMAARYVDRGVRYLFTGQRNSVGNLIWRVPGFAFNIGIRQTDSQVVVLSSSDVYHLGDTVDQIVQPTLNYQYIMGTMAQVLNDDGSILDHLRLGREGPSLPRLIKKLRQRKPTQEESYFTPHPDMPYFLAVYREHLMYLRGYDEDFTGYACDDNDLVERLCKVGCEHHYTKAECIHLYHKKTQPWDAISQDTQYQHNLSLWVRRRNKPRRNLKREWGQLQ